MDTIQKKIKKTIKDIPLEWKKIILFNKKKLIHILTQLYEYENKEQLYPKFEYIFNFTRLTQLHLIKIIILDIKPTVFKDERELIHGLSFSTLSNNIPYTLNNIYSNMVQRNILKETPKTSDLSNWARQGILLLNINLTNVLNGTDKINNIWYDYMSHVLLCIVNNYTNKSPLIILSWGKFVQNFTNIVYKSTMKNYVIMKYYHPSSVDVKKRFDNCSHFKKILNIYPHIEWNPSIYYKKIINKFKCSDKFFGGNIRKHVIFTDGSCKPNNSSPESRGGYSALFVQGLYNNTILYGSIDINTYPATNNRAEAEAIFKALEYISNINDIDDWDSCDIVTDSEFWFNMITQYIPGWYIADDNLPESAKNKDVIIKIWNKLNQLKLQDKIINLMTMRGHGKSKWNLMKIGTYERFCYEQNDLVDVYSKYGRNLSPDTHIINNTVYE